MKHARLSRRRLALEAVESTNALALEAARSGDPGPLWITAERQLAGRGRRGRSWDSPAGNVYASLMLIDPAPLADVAALPLVAALGVCEGLASFAGSPAATFAIKWPNDILLNGGKCAGILLESETLASGSRSVVIGCGINIDHRPAEALYPVACLRDADVTAGVEEAFQAVADGLETALGDWERGANFAAIRQRWLSLAVGLGAPCRVNLPNGPLDGRFVELDDRGRLVLETGNGARRSIAAGDVFFGPSEGARPSGRV